MPTPFTESSFRVRTPETRIPEAPCSFILSLLCRIATRQVLFFILEGAIFVTANIIAGYGTISDFSYQFAHTTSFYWTLFEGAGEWLGIVAMILFLGNGIGCLVGLSIMGFYRMVAGD